MHQFHIKPLLAISIFFLLFACSQKNGPNSFLSFFFDGVPPPMSTRLGDTSVVKSKDDENSSENKEQTKQDSEEKKSRYVKRSRVGGHEKFTEWLENYIPIPFIGEDEKEVVTAKVDKAGDKPQLPEAEIHKDYNDVIAILPRDNMGQIDWVKSLSEGNIKPRPSLDPNGKDLPQLQLNIEFNLDNPALNVVFPHGAHTAWLTCTNCHPGIFMMKKGGNDISMAKILSGEFCGKCHGKVAFNVATGCPRCHIYMGKGG